MPPHSRRKAQDSRKAHNRIAAIMLHTSRYSFQGPARLAADIGVSRSTICRMLAGQTAPSFALAMAVLSALEQQLGRSIDPREILTFNGEYPTPSVCELVGCKGCLPDEAYAEDDTLRPEYQDIRPGEWSLPEKERQQGRQELRPSKQASPLREKTEKNARKKKTGKEAA